MDWTALDRIESLRLWWRDDDAAEWTPELARLVELAARYDVPLAIAAVPTRLGDEARRKLVQAPHVTLLVHGYAHTNHAPADEKKAEFGRHRSLAVMTAEIAAARDLLPDAAPIFVPPWNRIDPDVAAALPGLGFRGLSTHGARRLAVPGLTQVNTMVDPIDWRGGGGFLGAPAVLSAIADAAAHGAVGLLTHHAVMDPAMWRFFEAFLAHVQASLAVAGRLHWSSPGELFSMPA